MDEWQAPARAGNVVLPLTSPWRDGTTHLRMSPLEFMQRLAALVPRPRLHLIRFHGVLAPNAGQAYHLRPPYPCHYYMHGTGRYGLQCLTNLDKLPATSAIVIAAPLRIRNGSASPMRALALVPG